MEIGEVLNSINNYFENKYEYGDYSFDNEAVLVKGTYYKDGYVRIIGTAQNDGVYKVSDFADGVLTIDGLKDEEAEDCYIVRLAIPSAFLTLFTSINTYYTKALLNKGLKSESVSGYYSASYGDESYKIAFKDELAPYKKMKFTDFDFLDRTTEFED